MKLKVTTELLFIIPFALTLYYGIYVYSAIILTSVISGLAYHVHNEKKYFALDVVISLLLISTNLYYLYLGKFKSPFFQLAMIAMISSLYFWAKAQKKEYDFNHSLWHIASGIITSSCILAYAY